MSVGSFRTPRPCGGWFALAGAILVVGCGQRADPQPQEPARPDLSAAQPAFDRVMTAVKERIRTQTEEQAKASSSRKGLYTPPPLEHGYEFRSGGIDPEFKQGVIRARIEVGYRVTNHNPPPLPGAPVRKPLPAEYFAPADTKRPHPATDDRFMWEQLPYSSHTWGFSRVSDVPNTYARTLLAVYTWDGNEWRPDEALSDRDSAGRPRRLANGYFPFRD